MRIRRTIAAVLAALACVLSVAAQSAPVPAREPLTVMSFNIRYGTANDGDNHWNLRREFLFGSGPEEGKVRAALRYEGGHLVEVREGAGEPRQPGMTFEAPGAAASGWEADGSTLWPALRAAVLEPIPNPPDRPVPPLAALPAAAAQAAEDRYLVYLERPLGRGESAAWEEGELADWRALWTSATVPGWGFVIEGDGTRRIVFPWPATRDDELVRLCRSTVERRRSTSRE